MQIAGLRQGYGRAILRPQRTIDSMSDVLAYGLGKKTIDAGNSIPKEVLRDTSSNQREWL
ncbi:MAG: hypothetical protein HRT36_01765 [Alphaproteobacteria bacterium]|nr:hypothetical protein [Alphaproteobacteria bacterium]